jgi:hypothetical protein
MTQTAKSRSPLVWIAVGCAGIVVLCGLVVAAVGFFGYRKVKQFEADMKDPSARAAKTAQVLGARELPAGYFPLLGFSVPFVMDTAMLSDREVPEGERPHGEDAFDERGFIYVKMLQSGHQRQELEDYFAGRRTDPEALRGFGVEFEDGEVLRQGTLAAGGGEVRYVARRSRLHRHGDRITATVLVACQQDRKLRLGIWFTPDPAPERAVAELDVTGTAADEAALKAFLDHFQLCGG